MEDGKEKAGYRNGTPEEKETDEVALGASKRRKTEDGWQRKLPRTPIKVCGLWSCRRKNFTLLDQNLFERENASHRETAWGPFRGQEWSLSLSSRN